jgi:hypothetical protein
MFRGEVSKITDLSWMRIMDKYLISFMPVGNIGEKALKTI